MKDDYVHGYQLREDARLVDQANALVDLLHRDTRYPVFISRNKQWTGTAKLYTDEQIGAGFVHAYS